MNPFEAKVILKYNNSSFTGSVESFTYTDNASSASDSISVTLKNINRKWNNQRMPKKASKITASIQTTGEDKKKRTYRCGTFYLDDMEFQGYPSTINIGAVSDPVNYSFKNRKRDQTWNKTTLKQVAGDIAKRYKFKLKYSASTIKLSAVEQDGQTDSEFLDSLCKKYGCGLKLYAKKIVIYEIERYESRSPKKTIYEKDMEPGWNYHTTINGNYNAVKLSYTGTDGNTIEVKAGKGKRVLELNEKADNRDDAMKIALARVNAENADTTTLRFTLRKPAFISSTQVIRIRGLGKLSGKYFVTRVRHTLNGGYKVQIEARKVSGRIYDPKRKKMDICLGDPNETEQRIGIVDDKRKKDPVQKRRDLEVVYGRFNQNRQGV